MGLTYQLQIETENLDAFDAACNRLELEYTTGLKSELFTTVFVRTNNPEMLFALGLQYHFYKGVNLKIPA